MLVCVSFPFFLLSDLIITHLYCKVVPAAVNHISSPHCVNSMFKTITKNAVSKRTFGIYTKNSNEELVKMKLQVKSTHLNPATCSLNKIHSVGSWAVL